MTLKLSIKKILYRLLSIFSFTLFFLLFVALFPRFNNELVGVIILLCIGVLPNIILLVEYFITTVKIDTAVFSENHLNVTFKNGDVRDYKYTDIKVIELYKAAGMDKGNYSFKSNERYYFAKIVAKDGRKLILTSLLGPDLGDALDLIKGVSIDRTKTGYAFIFMSR